MDFKQMQKILDNAPDKATGYSTQSNDYFYGQKWVEDHEYLLSELRIEIAKREPMDLRDVDIPHGTIVLER